MPLLQPVQDVKSFVVTAPASTAIASPVQVDMTFPPAQVVGLELIVPNGHNGQTGIAIAAAHQPVLPSTAGQYIITNDEKIEWPLIDQPDSGSWQAFVYNLDRLAHNFYVRFLTEPIAQPLTAAPSPLVFS